MKRRNFLKGMLVVAGAAFGASANAARIIEKPALPVARKVEYDKVRQCYLVTHKQGILEHYTYADIVDDKALAEIEAVAKASFNNRMLYERRSAGG